MESAFASSTVKLLLLIFCLSDGATLVPKTIDENKDKGYIVHTFPSPSVGSVYSFFQPADAELTSALKLFQISPSGVVKTTRPITYEIGKSNTYDLVALQRPPGVTEGGVATGLRVTISDTNNFSPTFPANNYYGQVQEQSSENVVVQGLEDCFAEDRDESGIKEFKISSGDDKGYFKAEKKTVGGRSFLILKTTAVKIVRSDATPNIVLTVRAEDGMRYGSTKVTIKILDFNDNPPKFEQSRYSVKVAENTPLLTSVFRVRATDEDVGVNGGIYYYLSTLSDYFSVDAITGVIKVVRELNYQTKSSFALNVVAQDRGTPGKSSTTRVDISLEGDIPNFPRPASSSPGANTPPFFADGPYTANVREDMPAKAALLTIHAVDRDPPGINSELTYGIVTGAKGKFQMNSKSGVVTLSNTLDYEGVSNKEYKLSIEVSDAAGARATTDLTIKIQDVNENRNAPVFASQQIEVKIDEDKSVNSRVVQVVANDRDTGNDGKVVYSAIKGSGLPYFEVEQATGIVRTVAPLDRERTTVYDLLIEARDQATFPLSSKLYLMIKVENVDDYLPDFGQAVYQAKVPEKSSSGTFVTVVHAVDKDGPSVSYGISGGSAFKMERESGIISTLRSIDPSSGETNFMLQVSASNGRQSNALVNVTVTSGSDSPPTFRESSYKVSVPENQGQVESLLCIAAVGPLGQPAQYSIVAPSDGRFIISRNSGEWRLAWWYGFEWFYSFLIGD